MMLFNHREFDHHQQVNFCHDAASGLYAIIAIHNTNLGPALGGCRMFPYRSESEALTDVLRLSRGMSYKAAIANLPLGGGKSVIIGDPHLDKSSRLMAAMGEAVERLGGRYIVAEDSGTNVADLRQIATTTGYVAGVAHKFDDHGRIRSADPSPTTARGVLAGIQAALQYRFGNGELTGVRIAIQGIGKVGTALARQLAAKGARLWLSDIDDRRLGALCEELNATPVESGRIYDQRVDLFAPCALGAVINDATLNRLHAKIIAGSANNQLAGPRYDSALYKRGILYAPDYVINAGGLIDVYYEQHASVGPQQLFREVDNIGMRLTKIFQRATQERMPTGRIADMIAEERLYHNHSTEPLTV